MRKWLLPVMGAAMLAACSEEASEPSPQPDGQEAPDEQQPVEQQAVPEGFGEAYFDENGFIHAYPSTPDSQYLSESIGLYMEYLVMMEDEGKFAEQYENLMDEFVVEEGDNFFINWLVFEDATVNALIDDIRIAAALRQADQLFGRPEYSETADRIIETISRIQTNNGYTVDYYDWEVEFPAQRVTLSYLIDDVPKDMNADRVLENVDEDEVFFPEYFDVVEEVYVKGDVVHPIDQLLIAINRERIGLSSDLFEEWLKAEWEEEGRLYGRYDRETLQPAVTYESLAMYFFMNEYFLMIGEEEAAEEVKVRATEMIEENGEGETHFFDFIHYHLMMEDESK
ncbi:hypothetical protein [Planococcus maitriensis]|uniref:Uncharacterized protein n=1 Tax=Planococcus maitriensis TaxID=221799 RepID=A0A365KAE7_9BACL|nr:hypothetical protein [Planococcus maitriensis]RAZ69742.1 hypothetical protein DP119_03530 [Planococcus maitriensis]